MGRRVDSEHCQRQKLYLDKMKAEKTSEMKLKLVAARRTMDVEDAKFEAECKRFEAERTARLAELQRATVPPEYLAVWRDSFDEWCASHEELRALHAKCQRARLDVIESLVLMM